MTVPDRLKTARSKLGYTQKDLAEALGVTKAAVSSYETGRVSPSNEVHTLLSSLGINISWLLTGEGEMLTASQSDGGQGKAPGVSVSTDLRSASNGSVVVPTAPYGHGASMPGRDNGDTVPVQTVIPEAYLRMMTGGTVPTYPDGSPRVFLTHAVGDSMAPYIPDGHPVLIELEAPFVDGSRYALWLGEVEADVIKRVEVGARGIVTLRSDNPNVRPKTLIPTEDEGTYKDPDGDIYALKVRGRVLWPFDTGPAVFGQLADFARSLFPR